MLRTLGQQFFPCLAWIKYDQIPNQGFYIGCFFAEARDDDHGQWFQRGIRYDMHTDLGSNRGTTAAQNSWYVAFSCIFHPGNVGFFMGMFSSNKSGGIVGDLLGEAIGVPAMGLWGS